MKYIKNIKTLTFVLLLAFSCQKMERPVLGDYPKDANPPGGPLKFYVAFDGTSENAVRNAVDSIQANFPSDNPLLSIEGISGKAIKGEKYKYIKYSTANDFAAKAGSFTVAFWQKKGLLRTEHVFSMPAVSGYHWSGASMFLLQEGTIENPVIKLFVKDSGGEKWFEWVPGSDAGSVKGLYDNQWHHLVFVYDAAVSAMTLYLDGTAKTSITWKEHGNVKLEPAKISALKIGAGPQEFSAEEIKNNGEDWLKNSWTGSLDQFRMYTTALSAAEVAELYNNKK